MAGTAAPRGPRRPPGLAVPQRMFCGRALPPHFPVLTPVPVQPETLRTVRPTGPAQEPEAALFHGNSLFWGPGGTPCTREERLGARSRARPTVWMPVLTAAPCGGPDVGGGPLPGLGRDTCAGAGCRDPLWESWLPGTSVTCALPGRPWPRVSTPAAHTAPRARHGGHRPPFHADAKQVQLEKGDHFFLPTRSSPCPHHASYTY